MSSKLFTIFILVFKVGMLLSQSQTDIDLVEYSDKGFHFKKKSGIDAPNLVNQLIKDKVGDHEKFDAIFKWVTANIKYDHTEFYFPTEFNPKTITGILKKKRTICLGYSNLMDTLCKLAGITNITVYGYAKDEYFDVHDTVYFHNHAWNAVKLNSLWYLYDATWSSGRVEIKLTQKSNRIVRWIEKHPEKWKKRKFGSKFKRRIKNMCDGELGDGKWGGPVYYYKIRWLNHMIRKWAMNRPIKTKKVFKKGTDMDYYLTEPRLFTMTHMPDDPTWNLGDSRTFRELEVDSAYYYYNDNDLNLQLREGTVCEDCDRYASLNSKRRLQEVNAKSQIYNKHNHCITTLCEKQIGNINWKQADFENDSLIQMQFLDSALASYSNAYYQLKNIKEDVKNYLLMHKSKNKHKKSLLLEDNKMHTMFMSHNIKRTLNQLKTYNILTSQAGAYAVTYLKKASRTKKFKIDIKTDKLKPYPENILKTIYKDLSKKERQLDSLHTMIQTKQLTFDSLMFGVSLNIWQQMDYPDSISKPFWNSINLRRLHYDNYKKEIVDIRKTIPGYELTYGNNLEHVIYKPSEKVFALFKNIVLLIKHKTKLQNECLKYHRELLRAKELSYDKLKQYKNGIIKDSETDFCWIAGNYSKLTTMGEGLRLLKTVQDIVIDLIKVENNIERQRHFVINKEIQNGYRKTLRSLAFEIRIVKFALKWVKHDRKCIIKGVPNKRWIFINLY